MDVAQKPGLVRLSAAFARLLAGVRQALQRVRVRRTERALRVCETLPLGERRLLLLVQCERRRYLIGATAQTITLIDRLDETGDSAPDDLCCVDPISWKGPH